MKEKVIPFLNIYDEGFRIKNAAYRFGEHYYYNQTAQKVTDGFDMLKISVVSDYKQHETVINVCKRLDFIPCEYNANIFLKLLNNVWLVWSFNATIMFNPILYAMKALLAEFFTVLLQNVTIFENYWGMKYV